MSSGFQERQDVAGLISRVFNLPLLTAGLSAMIVSTLLSRTGFTLLLESKVFTSIGKYSYSMYLWHWLIASYVVQVVKVYMSGFLGVNTAFIISIALLYPVSVLSFSLFESIYFRNKLHPGNFSAIRGTTKDS